jgi:purine-binding chemotaxis protein CheW
MKQYCTFKIEDETFAIDVNSIQEIINLPRFTKIPRAKNFITGMFTLRGQIVTNYCINTLFQMQKTAEYQHCIVIKSELDPISMNVNEVLDIIDVEPNQIEATPEIISENIKQYLEGIIKTDNLIITLLNVEKLNKQE